MTIGGRKTPFVIGLLVSVCLVAACAEESDFERGERKEHSSELRQNEGVDTAASFDLDPSERALLERQAKSGHGDAAFRLALYWGIAGGDIGQAGDPRIGIEEERWLRVAADAGHETAKHNLAVEIAARDCPTARAMLAELAETAADPRTRKSAEHWLRGQYLCRATSDAK